MTYNNLLEDASSILKKNGIEDYKYEAKQILLELADIDLANLLCICEKELSTLFSNYELESFINDFNKVISLRARHVPLQYIFCKSYFCGLEFYVDENVLIPRQDTECLVERVLADNSNENIDILDMCTGSGCIAISLSYLGHYKKIIGVDISHDALEIAAKNAKNIIYDDENEYDDDIQREILFFQSDLFSRFNVLEEKTGIDQFDLITCNPPYIRKKDLNNLQDEIKLYEPKIALDGFDDGLHFYKEIAKNAKKYLKPHGRIYLEIGYDQANDVVNIFKKHKYSVIDIQKDIENRDRVVIVENE